MSEHDKNNERIVEFLSRARTIAVVGLSDNPARDSYEVGSYLQAQGYEIIPVNPNAKMILGRVPHQSLCDVEGPVDLVDVFRRSEEVPTIVDDAIAIGAKGIWLQLGIENAAAEQKARAAGLFVISNRCMKVEHMRLLGKVAQ